MFRLFREYRQWSLFKQLQRRERRVVFYVEDGGSWTFMGPIITALIERHKVRIAYLTSSEDDPALQRASDRFAPFYIGEGLVRTFAFIGLQAPMMVMTMPDLQTFHIKRSSAEQVHYTYVFHAMTSTHMVYREQAFDHFDTILCVGPHHEREIRAAEKLRSLREKELVPHGYARLDQILADREDAEAHGLVPDPDTVLLAPTWGPRGLLEAHGTSAITALRAAQLTLIVRPHPMTARQHPDLIDEIRRMAVEDPGLSVDLDVNSRSSLMRSSVMISDWSGAALEYALGLEKPVVYLDLPPKVNNENWEALGIEPVEARLRAELGTVVPPDDGAALVAAVRGYLKDREGYRIRASALREQIVFNVGRSAEVAAAWIATKLEHLGRSPDG